VGQMNFRGFVYVDVICVLVAPALIKDPDSPDHYKKDDAPDETGNGRMYLF